MSDSFLSEPLARQRLNYHRGLDGSNARISAKRYVAHCPPEGASDTSGMMPVDARLWSDKCIFFRYLELLPVVVTKVE